MAQADDLHTGRRPRAAGGAATAADVCNRFLTATTHQLDAAEMTAQTFAGYKAATDRVGAAFGKTRVAEDLTAADSETLRGGLAEQYGPVRLGNRVPVAAVDLDGG